MFERLFLFLFFFVGIISPSYAQQKAINLIEELDSALYVGEAQIVKYGPSALTIETAEKPRRRLVKYSLNPSWNPETLIRDNWTETAQSKPFTGSWPALGSRPIIVINRQNVAALFAVEQNGSYRFWSSAVESSPALFVCTAPAKPLPPIPGKSLKENESLDGCLVPVSKLMEREPVKKIETPTKSVDAPTVIKSESFPKTDELEEKTGPDEQPLEEQMEEWPMDQEEPTPLEEIGNSETTER